MANGKTILIVEDDEGTMGVIATACAQQSHRTIEAVTGTEGLEKFYEHNPDLMILDVNLPGVIGWDICRKLRSEGSKTPIIMVTGKTETIDKVVGLELGADDYVVKPFEIRELMARVGAQLRRSEISKDSEVPQKIEAGKMMIDLGRRQVFVDGKEIFLTLTEFNLLALLASRKGQVMSRADLLKKVWGYDIEIETRTVDAHVYRLRRKVEEDPTHPVYIESVPGIGYRFFG